MRRKEHREQATEDHDSRASAFPPADELVSQKRARELLDEALEKMGDDLRAVFVLFEIEGLHTPELARFWASPLGPRRRVYGVRGSAFRTSLVDTPW
jgi:RNA polymerase sigma-70 factor (ECF subfamily)